VNPESDARYRDYWQTYHELMERRGVTPDTARAVMRTNTTAIGAIAVHRGDADSVICGTFGQYLWHLKYVREVLARGGLRPHGALSPDDPGRRAAVHGRHPSTRCRRPNRSPKPTCGAVRHARRFGVTPKVALCSHSSTLATLTAIPAAGCAPRWKSWTRARWISNMKAR
jgi:malate dehydrogenase (oxaloacetate-decarboxylating)(NADP+)